MSAPKDAHAQERLRFQKVKYAYARTGAGPREKPALRHEHVPVLQEVSFAIQKGERVALVGESGSGKSTLLQLAGLLDQPQAGELFVNGACCNKLSETERTHKRRTEIGFVFQFHHLLPEFNAEENVLLPQILTGVSRHEAQKRARELLGSVGLEHRLTHRPSELSGGERLHACCSYEGRKFNQLISCLLTLLFFDRCR